jgi:hypothetical protein
MQWPPHAAEALLPAGEPALDPLEQPAADADARPRRRFVLAETGFNEVPRAYRKFYRRWLGPPTCWHRTRCSAPVCKVVVRSRRELRPGDRVYCMPCMSRLVVVRGAHGTLEARPAY